MNLKTAYYKFAPRNQTFDEFKDMFDSSFSFEEAVKNWTPGVNNYSTFDANLARQFRKINQQEKQEFDFHWEQVRFLVDWGKSGDISRQERDWLYEQYIGDLGHKQKKWRDAKFKIFNEDQNIDNSILARVKKERRRAWKKMIRDDIRLYSMAQKFQGMSADEKLEFARAALDRSAELFCNGQKTRVSIGYAGNGLANCDYLGNITITREFLESDWYNNLDEFIDTLSHEDAHRIDKLNPNYGVLGGQKHKYSYESYDNSRHGSNLTEKSAGAIGFYVAQGSDKYSANIPPMSKWINVEHD